MPPANVIGLPDQETEVVYCACEVEVTGVAPNTGAVTPAIAAVLIVVIVAGKAAVMTPEPAELITDVAPATVK